MRNYHAWCKPLLMALFAAFHAKTGWPMDKDMKPGMLPLGPFDLTPLLSIRESYNDNIFSSNIFRKDSLITQIAGGGELALRRKLDRYALRYSFLSSQYHSSPADNYVDQTIGGNAHFEFTRRNRLDVRTDYIHSHYMRGTYYSQGIVGALIDGPDQFHRYDASLDYRYGRVDARGNLGLQMALKRQVFDNHRERTQFYDHTLFEATPAFYLRVMPKTYLTTQIENTAVKYDLESDPAQSGSPLVNSQFVGEDYTAQRFLTGVLWEQSSKTRGWLRGGYLQQQFTNSDLQGASGLTWDGEVQWFPKTYSAINLRVYRDIEPSIGVGSTRYVQAYEAGWKHTWPGYITTRLNGSYQDVAYPGTTSGSTSGVSFRFDVKYGLNSWMDLGMNYSYSDFQYQTNDTNSTRNIFMLYINAFQQAKPGY